MSLSFKYHDALHLTFAEAGNANIFLTTDYRLLNKEKISKSSTSRSRKYVFWLMNVSQTEEENNETNGN